MENKGYPKFQWSQFFGNGGQVVVRGDDYEQFVLDVQAAETQYVEDSQVATPDQPTQPTQPVVSVIYTCATCGSPANLKEGISKAGNHYKIMKCSADKEHDRFVK